MAFGNWQGVNSTFAPWLADSGADSMLSGVDCGTTDGYAHPDYTGSTVPGAQPSDTPSGTPVNPYVAGKGKTGNCEVSTGT